MIALEELMQAMADQNGPRSQILPEAQIMSIREAHERMTAPIPFKIGDLVTPRADAPINRAGEPHLVTGICQDGFPKGDAECGGWETAASFTVQCLVGASGRIVPCVFPHWMLEPYTGPVE